MTTVKKHFKNKAISQMKKRSDELKSLFDNGDFNFCTFDSLSGITKDQAVRFGAFLKKVAIHSETVQKAIANKVISAPPTAIVETNDSLFEHLSKKYKGTKAKELKFDNTDRKDRFRQSVINDNQLQFNNCIKQSAENTIIKFFDSININEFEPTDGYYEKKKEEVKKRLEIVEIVEPDVEPDDSEIIGPIVQPDVIQPDVIQDEPIIDYDSDIEEDIKNMEIKMNSDQEFYNDDELKKFKSDINKLWKNELIEHFENIEVVEEEGECEKYKNMSIKEHQKAMNKRLSILYDEGIDDMINMYIQRTKGQTRGTKKKIGEFSTKNPIALKKIIVSIINRIRNKCLKDAIN